jgi:hypothetical protein
MKDKPRDLIKPIITINQWIYKQGFGNL